MVSKMERGLSAILLVVLLLSIGLCCLRSSGGERALAQPWPRPLSDAPWSANVRVNDDPGAGTGDEPPAIAVDPSGNAYAVWDDTRNGNRDIYFSYRAAGGSWGANVKVSDDPGTESQREPAIAVDSSGNAYAVWYDYRNGDYDIYFSYRPAGGSWETNVKVNDDAGTIGQWSPAIAVDSSGNAYAVWMDSRNGVDNSDIYFSYRAAGGSWETNVKVNDDPDTADQWGPAIAVDSSGNAYAVWYDNRNGDYDIYFSYRLVDGSWDTNVKVNDDLETADQSLPAIAVDSSGNAYAVWMDSRNGVDNSDIYFSYRAAGGSWGADIKVNDDAGTADQWGPAIAVDSSGNAYAVWMDSRNGDSDIYFSYRAAGGSWETNVKVNDDAGTADQWGPAIAVDSSGNAYAVWTDYRNDPDGACDDTSCLSDIYFSYRPAGYEIYLPLIMKSY